VGTLTGLVLVWMAVRVSSPETEYADPSDSPLALLILGCLERLRVVVAAVRSLLLVPGTTSSQKFRWRIAVPIDVTGSTDSKLELQSADAVPNSVWELDEGCGVTFVMSSASWGVSLVSTVLHFAEPIGQSSPPGRGLA
jgi:hypothetical protein